MNKEKETVSSKKEDLFRWLSSEKFSESFPFPSMKHFPPHSSFMTFFLPPPSRSFLNTFPQRRHPFLFLSQKLYSSHWDTYRFVQKLEGEGFSRENSEAIMNSLSQVLDESVEDLSDTLVSHGDFESVKQGNNRGEILDYFLD